jgi:integrase
VWELFVTEKGKREFAVKSPKWPQSPSFDAQELPRRQPFGAARKAAPDVVDAEIVDAEDVLEDFEAEAAALESAIPHRSWPEQAPVRDDNGPELLEGELLPPEVIGAQALSVVTAPSALDARRGQAPAVDPVTSYLSRYVSGHSRRAMLSSLKVVARYLTGRTADPREVPWPSIRYSHVQALRGRLAANYAWSSANRHLLAMRGVMEECWRLGLVDRDTFDRIREVDALKATQQEVGRALSPKELEELLAACPDSFAGKRDAAIVALTAGGGMRRSEVCDARYENWDGARFCLQVLGKGNKWRTVFVSKKYHTALESWLKARGDKPGPFVLPVSKHGTLVWTRPLTSGGMYAILQALGKRAGVKDFTPHDLRRTYITRLLEKGADALTVSRLVGHSNVQTTMRYDKRDDRAKAAVAMLDD